MASNTGWTLVGEPEMTRRMSAVAVCCSRASLSRSSASVSLFSASARRFSRSRTRELSLLCERLAAGSLAPSLAFTRLPARRIGLSSTARLNRRQATPRGPRGQGESPGSLGRIDPRLPWGTPEAGGGCGEALRVRRIGRGQLARPRRVLASTGCRAPSTHLLFQLLPLCGGLAETLGGLQG